MISTPSQSTCGEPMKDCTSSIAFYLVNYITNKLDRLEVNDDGISIKNAKFVKYEAIKFLIVDRELFNSNGPHIILSNLIAAYAKLGLNVLLLDYTNVGSNECQEETVYPNIPKLGQCAADFVELILKVRLDIQLPQFHVISFDAGVHIAAYLAKELESGTLRRLTALEPITIGTPGVRQYLSKKSAHFVDVYYTNSGKVGVEKSDAHIEVYFNNGVVQEKCARSSSLCSHVMVVLYFSESILSFTGFFASKCLRRYWNGCIVDLEAPLKQVGEYATPENMCISYEKTVYTVLTNEKFPYALGYVMPSHESTLESIDPKIFLIQN